MVQRDYAISENVLSSVLFSTALISTLLFNGDHIYFLSMAWMTLLFWGVYNLSCLKVLQIRVDATMIVSLLFISWMVLSLYWHPVSWQGAYYNWHHGLYFLALLVAYLVLSEKNDSFVITAITLVGVAVALLSLYQSFILGEAAGGFFPNKNNNAAFLALFMLPQVSILLLGNSGLKQRAFAIFVIFVTFMAIVQVSSRGALIALATTISILAAIALTRGKWRNVLLFSSVIVLVLILDYFFSSVELRKNFESPARLLLLSSAFEMIKDGNWYGIGNGMFRILYPTYRHHDELSAGFFVHNDYVQVLLELGLPGLVLMIILALIITKSGYVLAQKRSDESADSLYFGLFMGLVTVAIHSMVTFNFYLASILLLTGLYSGILLRRVPYAAFNLTYVYSFAISPSRLAIVAFVLFVPVSFVMRMGYADAVEDGFINDDVMKSTPQEHYEIYRRLWQLDPSNHKYPSTMAMTYSLLGENESRSQREARFIKSTEILHTARELNPYLMKTYVEEALLIINYKDIVGDEWNQKAVALTKTALKFNSRAHSLRLRLAKLMVEGGDKQGAISILLDGLVYTHGMTKDYFEYARSLALELNMQDEAAVFANYLDEIKVREKKEFENMVNKYKKLNSQNTAD